ncbi:class I adenylate-forming enzyme family protein [Nocardia farcinica]|uniref:class I adenylate-forming enzyme family protein n=1 Tax=Nocardia farcinica TaxID=37329 RepID=UPI0037AAC6C4
MKKSARIYRDNTAFRCAGRSQTYGELLDRSARLANALADRGLVKGDRVALLSPNSFETLEQMGGLALGGFVRCPLYTHDTPERHRYLLELTGARALVVHEAYYDPLRPIIDDLAALTVVLVVGDDVEEANRYDRVLEQADPTPPLVVLADTDPHIIRFSAGTTGLPKGIMHTVQGWMGMGNEMALVVPRLNEHDRYLTPAPLTHAAGLFAWPLVAAGAATVVMPSYDTGEYLRLVEQEKATLTLLVPTMIKLITEHPDARTRELSSLHTVIYGTAPIDKDTLTAAIGVWGNIMYNIYGQSEALPLTVLTPDHHRPDGTEAQQKWLRSVGRPTPNSDIAILDEEDRPLPAGQIGEIAGSTPGRMHELWGNPEGTAQRLTSDGLVRTRDMGWLSEDGFLYLTDRKEDTIISGGYNIWPREIEEALLAHPAVAEAAVVGVPHPKWGETPFAEVALCDGAQVSEAELIEWTRSRLGPVKKVSAIEFVAAIPRTPIGKVARRIVRDHWQERHEASHD